jgi:hypothetical protein
MTGLADGFLKVQSGVIGTGVVDLSTRVPYSGATGDVDLGAHKLSSTGIESAGAVSAIPDTANVTATQVSGWSMSAYGYGYEFYVVPYKTINGTKIFAENAAMAYFYDDGSYSDFDIQLDWDAVTGVDGYRVFFLDNYNGYYYDYYIDVATNSLLYQGYYSSPTYESPITLTPTSYTGSAGDFTGDVNVDGNVNADNIIEEAPIDGATYGRKDGEWVGVTVEESDPVFEAWLDTDPLSAIAHNDTTDKQGGTAGEYYHLTEAQRDYVAGETMSFTRALTATGDWRSWYAMSQYILLLDMEALACFPNGITITSWKLKCSVDDPTTEINANLRYCDGQGTGAFPGANIVLVDVLDTTTGNASCTDMSGSDLGSGVIPAGKMLYVQMDADPTDVNVWWTLTINYTAAV